MYTRAIVIFLLIGASFAREDEEKDQLDSSETVNSKREAAISSSYGPPSSGDKEPAPVYGAPSHSHGSPASYSKSIPAAAIRNVETVAVTKTITPVVTKTTTYNTHSEPALSVGHVQGYSHSATGEPKIAPVQFQTQYTSYHNPTVGVNGPVTYTGPAVVLNGGYAIPLTGLTNFATAHNGGQGFTLSSLSSSGASSSNGGGSPAAVYGPPSESSGNGAPASTYGPPGQTQGSPLGSYSMSVPQYVALRQAAAASTSAQQTLSLQNIQQLQKLRAPAPYGQQLSAPSSISPVALRPTQHNSSPFAFLQQSPVSLNPYGLQASPSTSNPTALRYITPHQLQQLQASASSSAPTGLRYITPQQLQQLQTPPSSSSSNGLRYITAPQFQASPSSSSPNAIRYITHQQLQQLQAAQSRHQPQQPIAQSSNPVQYVQTYAMPSVSFTRVQPVGPINKHHQSQYQSRITRAFRY